MNPCDECQEEGAPKCDRWDICLEYQEWIDLRLEMIRECEPELSAPRQLDLGIRERP